MGNTKRREYAVIGGPVNKAARLMSKAKDDILVDEESKSKCADNYVLEELPALTIKGYDAPVKIFRPLRRIGASDGALNLERIAVGQEEILDKVKIAINGMVNNGQSGIYAIRGNSGMGKTHLLYGIKDIATVSNVTTLMSQAAMEEIYTPYFAFRGILKDLFKLETVYFTSLSPDEKSGYLKFQLKNAYKKYLQLSKLNNEAPDSIDDESKMSNFMLVYPLLVNALDGNLQYSVTTDLRDMDASERAAQLLELLFAVFAQLSNTIIAVENANYLDDISIALLTRLLKSQHCRIIIFLTICMEPVAPLPASIQELLKLGARFNIPQIEGGEIKVPPLERSHVQQIISLQYHVESWPPEVIDFVMEVGVGNPLYSTQVVQLLKRKNIISINNSKCQLTKEDGSELDTLKIGHVDEIIIDRLNDLSPDEKEFLKACSVAGSEFSVSMVCSILPLKLSSDTKKVDAILEVLCDQGFLRGTKKNASHMNNGKTVYKFDSNLIRNTIYNLNGESDQRRKMHRRIANHLHSLNSDDLAGLFPTLAYHYHKAGEIEKALKSYDMAAKNALYGGFYAKVIQFLQLALSLGEDARMIEFEGIAYPQFKLIQWEKQISTCFSLLGQVEESTLFKNKYDARCLRLKVDPSSVTPFFNDQQQKVNNRRRGVEIHARDASSLVEKLKAADKSVALRLVEDQKKSTVCNIL